MKAFGLAFVLGGLMVGGCGNAEPPRQFSQAALNDALADARRAEQSNADARRKPGELIALAGVKPGDKVLDLIPGSGYWTRIFSKIVGPQGKVYAVWPRAYANDPSVLNNAVFKMLKSGGTYMIIDHVAKAGTGLADTDTLHRVDPAIVRKEVEAAGFKFAGESDALINPADPLDIPVFAPAIRGRTSQFAYKFVKP